MEVNKIYNQDCVEGMQLLIPDESIDSNSLSLRREISHLESSFRLMSIEPQVAHFVSRLDTTAPHLLQEPNWSTR